MSSQELILTKTDEPELVRMYFDRNEEALRETEERYGSYCYHIVYSILRDLYDAKECENDTYLELWNTIPPSVPSCFRTFLGKIARHLAIDRKRRDDAERRPATDLLLEELGEVLPSDADPTREIGFKELCRVITEFLQALPQEQRVFFVQRYWYAMSTKEIAKTHNCTDHRVRAILSRIRKDLRIYLEKEGYHV